MKTIQVLLMANMPMPDDLVEVMTQDADTSDKGKKEQFDAIIEAGIKTLQHLALKIYPRTVWDIQRATKATLIRHDSICLHVGITDYQPPTLEGPFEVAERLSGFEVIHRETDASHWLSDGVDCLADENDEALSPGTPGFREYWEYVLNTNADETLEAYFPQLTEESKSE